MSRSWSPALTASSAATWSSDSCDEGARVRAFCLYNSRGSLGWLDDACRRRPATPSTSGSATSATPRFVAEAIAGVEVVFHLAALIAIPYSYVAAESFIRRTSRAR